VIRRSLTGQQTRQGFDSDHRTAVEPRRAVKLPGRVQGERESESAWLRAQMSRESG
jgi:hypothetical protein